MSSRLRLIASELSESYWFVPAVMAILAALLALAMVYIDSHFGSGWMDEFSWLHAARPDGARSLLSAVGGSMIGVAGTTFSVTIAAVVYASGQFGPRLLANFMADRGNQVTLGTFIATFVYSLIVLRTIRSSGENGAGAAAFVPQLALLVGVLLVIASVAVLIYFIHHVPQRIHINSVIEGIGARLMREIEARYPVFIGTPIDEGAGAGDVPAVFGEAATGERPVAVRAGGVGYVQMIDEAALFAEASAADLVLRLNVAPGYFVRPGSTLVDAWPPGRCGEGVAARLRGAFVLGNRRTALQDMVFLIDELVEIAARAMSPAINDPFTCSTALDWLGAAIADLAGRELPSRLRADDDGRVRIVAEPMAFAALIDRSFGSIAQYASTDMIAGLHFLWALGDARDAGADEARRAAMTGAIADFRALADAHLDGVNRIRVLARADALLAAGPAQPANALAAE